MTRLIELFLLAVLLVITGTLLFISLKPEKSDCTLSRGRLICPEAMKLPTLPRTALCDPETATKDRRCR